MDKTKFKTLNDEQKLKVQILSDTNKICKDVITSMDRKMTRNCYELIGELVWKKLEVFSNDLEQFAKHGKRVAVNIDDVKLLARRNPHLKEHISKMSDELANRAQTDKEQKSRKRKASSKQ